MGSKLEKFYNTPVSLNPSLDKLKKIPRSGMKWTIASGVLGPDDQIQLARRLEHEQPAHQSFSRDNLTGLGCRRRSEVHPHDSHEIGCWGGHRNPELSAYDVALDQVI